jgi:hypothetical protein
MIAPKQGGENFGYPVFGQRLVNGDFSAGDNYRRCDTDLIFLPNYRKCVVLPHDNLAGRESLRRPLSFLFCLQASGAGRHCTENQHLDAVRGTRHSHTPHPAR